MRVSGRDRRGPEHDVAEQLDKNPAEADHHDWTEQRVSHHPENGFNPRRDHRRDQHAVDQGLRKRAGDALADARVGQTHRRFVGEVEDNSADIGLVRDVGRDDLEHHREADLGSAADCIVGACRELLAGNTQTGLAQQLLGLVLREARAGRNRCGFRQDHLGIRSPLETVSEAGERGDGMNRAGRILEYCIANCLEIAADIGVSEQRHAQVAPGMALRDAFQTRHQLGDDCRIEPEVREKHDHRGGVLLVQKQFEHRLDQLGIVEDLRGDIHRIARPCKGQQSL